MKRPTFSAPVAALVDAVAIVVFVVIGRNNHHEHGSFVAGTARVAAPFLIALAVGWIGARAWRTPTAVPTGIVLWLATVIGGMLLRRFVFDDGTATPFIIVASVFTGLLLVGWRTIVSRGAERP